MEYGRFARSITSYPTESGFSGYAATAASERRLRRLRETMLREIDHRVKNNLQMVSSLVSLRSRSSADPSEALNSLKASRFLEALFVRFGSSYPGFSFDYDWKGSEVEVDSDVGIDLGVMINEMVANSVKHAFPPGQGGRIFLEASIEEGTRNLSLRVGDDGGGASSAEGGGLGRKIIDSMAQYLGAELRVDVSRGFVYRLELILPAPKMPEQP